MSIRHVSSVVDMLGAQVTTYQHLSCHCWKPCTISACSHGITHTPYTFTNWQWIFTGATHIKYKISKHTSHFRVCHGSSRPSTFNLLLMVSTHCCTMTQSKCANYMLKSAVPWCYFISDMLIPYFFKLSCVPVTGRKLKLWYKEHIHNREYNWDE